ncbi:alpha/beta fold hydrolase [Flexivirga alba]|uniref:Alpha/beta fold hydrolase n=1 Tax=Flexivirga alba TaxID=702742 RepID=A0ABW2AB88_9MICO
MIASAAWRTLARGLVELAYAETGAGDHPVILLHGLAGTAQEWSATLRALGDTHRIVALEQRGHGHSTRMPQDVTRAAYVADVVALIEQLGGGPATLVGQSMGGHTAMLVAAEKPHLVRQLVMVEAGVGGGGDAATAPVEQWLRSWPARFPDRDAFIDFFMSADRGAARSTGTAMAGEAWADGLQFDAGGLVPCWDADVLIEALRAVHVLPRWRAWESVSVPTHLVVAEHSVIPTEQVERMRRGAHVERTVIADAGHDLHLDQPQAWRQTLERVLNASGPVTEDR